MVDWVIAQFAAREDLSTAAGKRAFTTAALTVVRALHDPVEQDHYVRMITQMTDISREALDRKLQAENQPAEQKKQIKQSSRGESVTPVVQDKNQDTLLAVALLDASVRKLFQGINHEVFLGVERQAVAAYLANHADIRVTAVPKGLEEYEKYVTMLLLHPDVERVAWNEENRVATATEVLRSIHANYQKTNTKEELMQSEREARERGDDVAAAEYLRQLNSLIKGEK